MNRALLPIWLAAIVIFTQLSAACDDQSTGPEEEYPEGTVTIGVSRLDVGLLKGEAAAEADDGWRVAALKVTAVGPGGDDWTVLEFPEGIGSPLAAGLFEVVIQELPRGDQLEITATAAFENDAGDWIERAAGDRWPP